MKETIANINKTKSWFFENIDKTDKPLAKITEKKKEDSNQQNYKWKRSYNRQCRNTKDYKRWLWTNIWQENG